MEALRPLKQALRPLIEAVQPHLALDIEDDATFGAVAAAIILGALIAIYILVGLVGTVFKKKKGDTVLFLGNATSGKTALFFRLLSGSEVNTHTSMVPNEKTVALSKNHPTYRYVDYPGHQRLRQGINKYVSSAAGIVFVVDSIDMDQGLATSASFLVDLLTNPQLVMARPPPKLAIACTKRDIPHSYKSSSVKRQLEVEIEKVRKTVQRGVGQIGGGDGKITLGVESEKFSFDKHSPFQVTVLDVAAKTSDSFGENVEQLSKWLERL
eukprot:Sspe_Gene.35088::Locus_17021_Transcript_2_2_Confidence_0.500_Length_905::g.35088::m.35088/K12272/SRPRB, SRP102; signal recognition particle receptor subunit beta